mmetsp:Transcript_18097/g.53816  ORF Transcript_18097/g.53816 Transcript_18097/m.53816 type:complete len:204 (+) Transcript_18097:133-744(+)
MRRLRSALVAGSSSSRSTSGTSAATAARASASRRSRAAPLMVAAYSRNNAKSPLLASAVEPQCASHQFCRFFENRHGSLSRPFQALTYASADMRLPRRLASAASARFFSSASRLAAASSSVLGTFGRFLGAAAPSARARLVGSIYRSGWRFLSSDDGYALPTDAHSEGRALNPKKYGNSARCCGNPWPQALTLRPRCWRAWRA